MAAAVGSASISVVSLASKDEVCFVYGDSSKLDEDFDPYSWDASYYSAIAYSGSGPWDNKNVEKRREFWLWYIEKAVAEAYMSYQE